MLVNLKKKTLLNLLIVSHLIILVGHDALVLKCNAKHVALKSKVKHVEHDET